MNAFRDGTWHFRAAVEPTAKRWQVHYFDTLHQRNGLMRFMTREAAEAFAKQHDGEVKEIAPRPFRLEGVR